YQQTITKRSYLSLSFSSSMADENYHTKYQQLKQANPSKYYTNFLYKALIVTIFLIILLLFPSQAPEFLIQTLNSRGWEFLHLVFVGIAVSYGLFSKRNDETETKINNNNPSRFDNAQSYVSAFLQVSSVFDDEVDSPPESEETKVQTWSNQYYRNDPVVVVAEQNSALDKEQRAPSSRIGEKPLLLPVRSLKSRLIDADVDETGKEYAGGSASINRSNSDSGSKIFSSNSSKNKSGEFGGSNCQELEEKLKENFVLPSPIPWRSRSGRMEMKEEADIPPYNLPPFSEEFEYNRSFNSQVPRSARTSSATSSPKLSPSPSFSSPKKFSPSPSFSSEVLGKSVEDFVRKKSIYRSPPPPPPPTPPVNRESSSMKPISSAVHDEVLLERELKRSFTTEPKDLNRGGKLPMLKSVRTIRSNDLFGEARREKEFHDRINSKEEKRSKEVEARGKERTGRKKVGFDQSSFQTERQNLESVSFTPQPTFMEFPEEENIAGSSFASSTAASPENDAAAASIASDGGPDVDKKADEFIAKFREQIRLQRIESIKKSSAQIRRNPSK
ncbi:PREDICTED: serine/arginine repetitive matrix protein 1-like, partial [Populus euphratica]|uniref:Serine/arginine repetitive matrix protein 1-like n=1 Tax=Populus euphratica TaxID=75702 RepID=A0AAJ6VHE4_POPEU